VGAGVVVVAGGAEGVGGAAGVWAGVGVGVWAGVGVGVWAETERGAAQKDKRDRGAIAAISIPVVFGVSDLKKRVGIGMYLKKVTAFWPIKAKCQHPYLPGCWPLYILTCKLQARALCNPS
jgi:hypothetical protein